MEKDSVIHPDSSHASQAAEGDSLHHQPTDSPSDSESEQGESSSASFKPVVTQSSSTLSAHGEDANTNCKTESVTDSSDSPVHTQPVSSQVGEVGDGSDNDEFLSASEGEDDDDEQKLEEWAETISDLKDIISTPLSTEKEFSSEKREVCSHEKSEEKSPAVGCDNGENAALDTFTEKPEKCVETSSDSNVPDKEQMDSSSEMCQDSVPKKDEAFENETEKLVEEVIAAAGLGSEEDDEAGAEDDGGDGENKESEELKKEEMEAELKRQEEEDTLPEKELQKRLSDAVEVKTRGNDAFKSGEYHEALQLYSEALELCPLKYIHQRALMLSNRAACQNREGYYERAVKDSSKSVELDPSYIKAYFRRADAYEKLEKLEEALKDHQKVVEMDRTQAASFHACVRLEKEIQERNEKMKDEMLGKLKDLGNLVLRPFGLSTNNFQLQQDPNSGSYSVQFVQQPPTNGH
ncbi:hypothetical protein ACOMHN_036123 [Nucella lapillus]